MVKSSRTSSQCRLYFISFRIIEPLLIILKIEYRLSRRVGSVCSLANYSVAYEETPISMIMYVLCFQRQSFFFNCGTSLWFPKYTESGRNKKKSQKKKKKKKKRKEKNKCISRYTLLVSEVHKLWENKQIPWGIYVPRLKILFEVLKMVKLTRGPLVLYQLPRY